jgi:hypothetical protein
LPKDGAEHAIEITSLLLLGPIYPQGIRELKELKSYLDEARANRWIRHSISLAGSLILFILKLDRSLRLYVDYRRLNKVTIKNRHLLPLVSEILDRLTSAAIFTKLDLKNTYYRIRIRRRDE